MRTTLRLPLATALLALPLVGVISASAAPGGAVARYQATTTTYQVMVLGTYEHDYTVTNNPCDGSITITGATPTDSGYYTTETLTGTQSAGTISFHSVYDGPYNPGYHYDGSFPVGGGALSGDYTGTVTQTSTSTTSYANHGQYVSSQGGGDDAAHSCIGMPVQSQK
jgi:hypothetical protein